MSITDELREYALGWDERNRVRRDLRAIADRIDAEYQKAIRELNGLAEDSVLLPKDADGEYIHIGDKLIDEDDKPQKPAIVKCILYNDEGCVVSDIDPRGCWYDPSLLRHHHAPTVEDVLEELLREYDRDDSELTNGEIIEMFAKRLTLAEVEDA